MNAFFTVNKDTEFVGNPIRFDASGSTGPIDNYVWDFDNGAVSILPTSAASADHAYQNYGNRLPSLTVWNSSASDTYTMPLGLTINPHPHISISGAPVLSSTLQFTDASGPYYFTSEETEVQLIFNYGDGSPSVSGDTTDIFPHQFSAAGNYLITLTATDVYGDTSVDTRTISILVNNTCNEKPDYINLCGPDNRRFGPCKSINLTNFLSDYLQETDVYYLVQFFENFLNTMYSGLCGFQTIQTQINTSASELTFTTPTQNMSADPRISILEKIKRLVDLHDPDLIDIEYIQFFAKYLGYNVEISRGEIGGFGTFETSATVCSASENEKYLRFMVSNLPNWYKIKTTRDMIKVMLYSFGLVGDIIQYYTKPVAQGGYDRNFINWKPDDNDDLVTIPDDWFPTPHFSVKVDIDRSIDENPDVYNILNILMTTGDKIIRAIESVRPINDVFHNLTAITTEYIDIWVGAQTRFSRYIRVDPEGDADWWVTSTPSMVKYIIETSAEYDSVQIAAFKTAMGNHINSLPQGTNVRFEPIVTYAGSGLPSGKETRDIIVDGSNMLVAVYGDIGGVYISTNDGASWALSSTGITTTFITCLTKRGSNIYAGTEDAGVFKSSDGGATWTAYNVGLTTLNIRDLCVYPYNSSMVAATDSGVFLSNSSIGEGWADLTGLGGLLDVNVQCVFFNSADNYIYAGTATGGIFRSPGTYYGSWSSYNIGLTNLNIRAINYWNGNLIAGTENGVFYYDSGWWYPLPIISPTADADILSLFVDGDNNLIIGIKTGAFLFNGIQDYFIGIYGTWPLSFVEKGTALYACYREGINILDKSKTVEGVIVRQDNEFFSYSNISITMYKDNVVSSDPITMTAIQQPTFDSDGTEFNHVTCC